MNHIFYIGFQVFETLRSVERRLNPTTQEGLFRVFHMIILYELLYSVKIFAIEKLELTENQVCFIVLLYVPVQVVPFPIHCSPG